MRVTVASFKGGVGKTTTAVHLAAYLQQQARTLLIDGDANRSATEWASAGRLPFEVVDERQAATAARDYQRGHVVIDTEARPAERDLRALAAACDLLVLPVTPDVLALKALTLTVQALQALDVASFRVLLTIVPSFPSRDGDEARAALVGHDIPLFRSQVRRAVAFQKAALAGVIVNESDDPRAELAWGDYLRAGKEMTKEMTK